MNVAGPMVVNPSEESSNSSSSNDIREFEVKLEISPPKTTSDDETVEPNEAIESNSDQFQPLLLYNAFMNCVLKSNEEQADFDDVSLRYYLVAYEEITKFLYNLGNIFYFVIADLRRKIGQLETYLNNQPDEYETFKSMVKYEWSDGKLSKPVSLNKQNATRVVLRLHRALIFIIRLLERVFYAESHLRTPQLCCEAYESTLAKYHSWIVRRAATFGMRALPKREILISYMLKNENDIEKFPEFIRTVEKVYNITQGIYERYNILELP